MIKYCLHIIKGGSCRDGIATVFELFAANSKVDKHIVLSIMPVRYPSNLADTNEIFTVLSFRIHKLYFLIRKLRQISASNYLVIKTWGHAAAFISRFFRMLVDAPVVWGIHDSGPGKNRLIRWLIHSNRKYSYTLPTSIICASQSTWQKYKDIYGYDHRRLNYIAYGLDSEKFFFDSTNNQLREKLNLPEEIPVIGIVARYSKEKGVDLFIEAMQKLSKELPNAKFIFCGYRMDSKNKKLLTKLLNLEILDKSILMGQRNDMPSIYSLMDILVLPSEAEALSCSLMEATSCGIACVSSDVGDSALIIRDTGRLLTQADSNSIKESCLSLYYESKEAKLKLKEERRSNVAKNFDLNAFIDKYDFVLKSSIG